jgi:hypothetical protein
METCVPKIHLGLGVCFASALLEGFESGTVNSN